MNSKVFKIGIFNSIGLYFIIRPILFITLIDFGVIFCVKMYYDMTVDQIKVVVFGLLLLSFIFYLLPLIILLLNYFIKNKGASIKIIYSNNSVCRAEYSRAGKKVEFNTAEINKIECNFSVTSFENRMKFFFWDEYFYYVIILKDNSRVFIPCILCDQIEEIFTSIKFIRIRRYFPFY
ncbi:hypothetical protein C8N46_107227 [Kordia periserrulae]|uniref:PH domain-containing protein n=1 Tax=Kordia periserrulae TaxID=701523 RepID=A0A2T6BVW9_9FLAO|nr:hypothetical protein C8N46_107227 [Kordia periserrulae]